MSNVSNEKQPSYYSIIPATVRYDERLKYPERLLYGEITALIGKEGYCFASNSYFSNLYKVIPGTISRWISHLAKLKYIKVELIKDEKNVIIQRRIYITDISCRKIIKDTYEQNSTYPYKQNCLYPMSQKAKDNNINIRIDRLFNYIIYNKGKIPEEFNNIEEYEEFYEILKKLELNYTEEIINTFREKNIEKLKIIILAVERLYLENKNNLLNKATRKDFIETYDNCKSFENSYKNTTYKIKNFFEYYFTSILRKLEAN